MDHYFEIVKPPWIGGYLTGYGMQVTTLFAVALLLLYLSESRRPKFAHFARWFIWLFLLQGLIASLGAFLYGGGLTGHPEFVEWLFVGLQEILALFFVIAEIFRYRKAFPKPDPRDKKKIGAPEGG